ncbi:hypothetical protein [Streptomyces sp. NPDC046182]
MNVELFAHPLSFRRQPQAQADRLAAQASTVCAWRSVVTGILMGTSW